MAHGTSGGSASLDASLVAGIAGAKLWGGPQVQRGGGSAGGAGAAAAAAAAASAHVVIFSNKLTFHRQCFDKLRGASGGAGVGVGR